MYSLYLKHSQLPVDMSVDYYKLCRDSLIYVEGWGFLTLNMLKGGYQKSFHVHEGGPVFLLPSKGGTPDFWDSGPKK